MIKTAIRKSIRMLGLDVVRLPREGREFPADFTDEEIGIIREVRPFTLTSVERIHSLIQAVRYLSANRIPGAVVECGVWKGGSMAAVARTLLRLHDLQRELFLFDTFEGMSEPTPNDIDYEGKYASDLMARSPTYKCADAPLDVVKAVLYETGYPREKIHFVQGRVEVTIPGQEPDVIALLRLDTDWYESTKHELTHLFPKLSENGVIIIDDYGHWKGSHKACDEYFAERKIPILLNRIDYTGRIALKQSSPAAQPAGRGTSEKGRVS